MLFDEKDLRVFDNYPAVMDVIRDNTEVFEYLSNRVLSKPQSLKYYRTFYPRSDKTTYAYFKGTPVCKRLAQLKFYMMPLKNVVISI